MSRYRLQMAQRRSQAERRASTRQLLLDAATKSFTKLGFHGATVATIAREAGVSTGALYAHFPSKDDLFLALLDEDVERTVDAVQRTVSHADRAHGWMTSLADDPERFVLYVEFWAYAIRRPDVRARFAQRAAAYRRAIAEQAAAEAEAAGRPLPMPADVIGLATVALAHGIAFEHLADPGKVPKERLRFLMERLLG